MITSNPYAHLTAKEREKPSFPCRMLYEQGLLKDKILDFGSGYGADGRFLRSKGLNVTDYDPYYAQEYPLGKYDTILCIYVLNVLLPEEQAHVLMDISRLLKRGGKAYLVVRRDVKRPGTFRTHYVHKKPTYQCNVVLPYKSIYSNEFTEIYEYQHYNLVSASNSSCPFCNLKREVVLETATALAFYDKFPVSKGHALIIPKGHTESYFELTFKEKQACWIIVNRLKKILEKKYHTQDFNVGINNGKYAGQTIQHAHIHLIPRYKNDIDDPTGGIRNVIPLKGNYKRDFIK